MAEPLRAVVLGASGVGRHHVKWLMRAGCKVVGFLGTTPGSVAKTTEMLRETLGFQGRGYTSLSELIGDCRPQLASVCSPMSVHYEHVMACLGAGAHVLCEKPLVGGETCTADTLLFLGERLVRTAENMNRLFAVNTQYAAVAPHLQAICEAQGVAPQPVTQFFMQMESRGHGGIREYETIWHDLAAHPISVLLALVPDGQVDWSTVNCIAERQQIRCTFDFAPPSGQVCRASILLRHVPEGQLQRRFGLNGVIVEYEGRNDEVGVYCAYLTCEGRELKVKDFMEESISRFATASAGEGTVLVTGRTGLKNLELQLRLIEKAHRV